MATSEQKLEKLRAELRLAKKQLRQARKLLDRAIDAIPNYTDRRNDKLTNAIDKWLFDEPKP